MSSSSGATLAAPSTACSALCPQISSLHTGTRGAEPPMPMTPISCLLTTTGQAARVREHAELDPLQFRVRILTHLVHDGLARPRCISAVRAFISALMMFR